MGSLVFGACITLKIMFIMKMLSSDDESAEEEEAEVKRMVEEKLKYLSDEDFGLEEDVNEGHLDGELTLEVSVMHILNIHSTLVWLIDCLTEILCGSCLTLYA